MSRRLRLLALAGVAALLAACGGDGAGAGGEADPATLAPAAAPVYLEGVVRPEGSRREDVLAAASKILRTDEPEQRIRELFDEATEDGDGELDYARDVEPWLGQRVGVSVARLEAPEPDVLLAAAAKDRDRAAEALADAVRREDPGAREQTYEDVSYRVTGDGLAAGVIGDFAAIGTEAAFRRAVDTSAAEGESLARAKRYRDTIAALPEERIGTAFVDLRAVVQAALRREPGAAAQLGPFEGLLELDRLKPLGASLVADGERIAVDTITSSSGLGAAIAAIAGGGATPLVSELPGDAWLAAGAPKVGATARTVFDRFAGALGGAAIAGQLESQFGLDLQEEVFAWIGDVALFVRGSDEATLEGAVVIQATDPVRARTAVTKLVGILAQQEPQAAPRAIRVEGAETAFAISAPGAAKPIVIAVGGGRAVVASGEAAARDGLGADRTLGDADGFQAARERLEGDAQPSLFLAMPALLGVVEATGQTGDPGKYARARPYLDAVTAVVAGAETDGELTRTRVAVTLR